MDRFLGFFYDLSNSIVTVRRQLGPEGQLFDALKHMHILQAVVGRCPYYQEYYSKLVDIVKIEWTGVEGSDGKLIDIVKTEEIGVEGGDGVVNDEIWKKGVYRITMRIHPDIKTSQVWLVVSNKSHPSVVWPDDANPW